MLVANGPGAIALTVTCLRRKFGGEDAGQMVDRRLRRRIGVGALGLGDRAHHRADVDDRRRPLGRSGGEEKRREVARQREQAGDVDRHHPLPRLPRIGRERRAPRHAGVVDQDVQLVRASANFVRQRGDAGLVRHRAAEALAGPDRRELARRRFARLRLARGDEDARAGGEQRLGADAPEPGRAAGDEGDAAGDGEEIGQGEHRRFPMSETRGKR